MNTALLRLFQHHVVLQCEFVLTADKDLHDPSGRNPWYAIQNLLTAAANISKALWGQQGKFAAERRPLRESLGVGDSSPLRPTTFRNHFDHFDERLADWDRESVSHNYVDLNVGIIPEKDSGFEPGDIFRNYDPGTGTLLFAGGTYSLVEIVEETQAILQRARREAAKSPWDDGPSSSGGGGGQ